MIYLVRHGETTLNQAGRHQGHLDSHLTPNGIEQARAAGRFLRARLSNVHEICVETSPLGRARWTATILCQELGLQTGFPKVSPLLIEHNMGVWEGLTNAEVDALYPGAREEREANKWAYVIPRGDSYSLIDIRARQWLASTRHAFVTIAVTHEMLSRTIQGAYNGLTPMETLRLSHRHDRIYLLHKGQNKELSF